MLSEIKFVKNLFGDLVMYCFLDLMDLESILFKCIFVDELSKFFGG